MARMTHEGFLGMNKRFEKVEGGIAGILELIDSMRSDIKYIRHSTKNLPLLERDMNDLQQRVTRLERRSGLAH